MKITGPRSPSSTTPTRKAGGARRGGFAVSAGHAAAGKASAAPVSGALAGASGVGTVDALLALQGVGGAPDAPARAAQRGGALLDALDGVKMALLEGRALRGQLSMLSGVARRVRDATNDPRLESILDDIEVRAAVEMAKHAAA